MSAKPGTTNATVSAANGDGRQPGLVGSGTSPVSPVATARCTPAPSSSQRGRSMPASQPTTTRNNARASAVANDRPAPCTTTICSICSASDCSDFCSSGVVSRANTLSAPGLHRSPRSAHDARARYSRRSMVRRCARTRASAARKAVAAVSMSAAAFAFLWGADCPPASSIGINNNPIAVRNFIVISTGSLRTAARGPLPASCPP